MVNAGHNDPDLDLVYTLQVRFEHPSTISSEISQKLGKLPDRSWDVGGPRSTPQGRMLSGKNKQTYWTYSVLKEGKRDFFKHVTDELNNLLSKGKFVESFIQTGGNIALIVGLPGSHNIGDVISPKDLRRIADAGVSLGIEVFPGMKLDQNSVQARDN
jgi:hypothetical protein